MAKIRSLKGEYFRHAGISRGGLTVKTLGAGLITAVADDEGRFKAAADYLRGEIFTHDNVPIEEVERGLQHLQSIDFIRLYQAQGRALGVIKNWKDHQPVPPSRFVASKLPPPPSSNRRKQAAGEAQASRKRSSTPASSRAGVGSDRKEDRRGTHGDVVTGDSNGLSFQEAAANLVVPVDHDVTALCEWLLNKRGWESFTSLDQARAERGQATDMLRLLPVSELLPWLDEHWKATSSTDRPSSLKYFWRPLQDDMHLRHKQRPAMTSVGQALHELAAIRDPDE